LLQVVIAGCYRFYAPRDDPPAIDNRVESNDGILPEISMERPAESDPGSVEKNVFDARIRTDEAKPTIAIPHNNFSDHGFLASCAHFCLSADRRSKTLFVSTFGVHDSVWLGNGVHFGLGRTGSAFSKRMKPATVSAGKYFPSSSTKYAASASSAVVER
jgi:hypothetical protein